MNLKKPILFFLAALSIAFCEQAPQKEIIIQLPTTHTLPAIYLGLSSKTCGDMDTKYLIELEKILRYDLDHNGHCSVMQHAPERQSLLNDEDLARSLSSQKWRQLGADYVIKIQVNPKWSLDVFVLDVNSNSIQHLPDFSVSKILTNDRYQIHKLADALCHALFHCDGIANMQILYALQEHNENFASNISEIWMCDWDGGYPRSITHEKSYCITPVYIPKTADFLYVSYKLGQSKVCVASLDNGHGKRVIELRGNQLLPAISPNRDKIAFICDAAGRADLFLQNFSEHGKTVGKPVQIFSYPRATQASPTFSPNGSQIAFVSDKDGSPRIYVIPTHTSTLRSEALLLTKKNQENSCPSWSPDGKKLAYSAKTKGIRQIWVYDFTTKEEWQLTDGPGNKENPVWAPNSLHLVFNSTEGENSELYVVNLNQPKVIKITQGKGKKHYPTWVKNEK